MVANIQYLTNAKGKRQSVIIPIDEWNSIISLLEFADEKKHFKAHFLTALQEAKEIQLGLKKPNTLNDMFDNED